MKKFTYQPLKELLYATMLKNGVCKESCFHLSEALIQTSLRGVDSHGINLFPHYTRVSLSGRINPNPQFTLDRKSLSLARLDADHGFGHHAGAVAMHAAIDIAKETGIGTVSVEHSTHFGAAAYYGFMAAEQDCIGLAFTNANDTVLAFNSTMPFFGTNPICMVAPMLEEGPFCLDMATAGLAVNKLANYKRTNTPLQPGLGFDVNGRTTTDPQAACYVGPVGGYKGFGLGMMVELFCGMLTGGPVANEIIALSKQLEVRRNLSQFFVAIDIARFIDPLAFKTRLQNMAGSIRSLPRTVPDVAVMIPGDPEKKNFTERSVTGIPLDEAKYEEFLAIDPAFEKALTQV